MLPLSSHLARLSLALQLEPGKPYPLGATTDATGVNFAIYSAHATQVELSVSTKN